MLGFLGLSPSFRLRDLNLVLTIGAVCGKFWSDSEFDFQLWKVQIHTRQNLGGPNMRIVLSTLNGEGIGREVCILPILVEAILEVIATSLMDTKTMQ